MGASELKEVFQFLPGRCSLLPSETPRARAYPRAQSGDERLRPVPRLIVAMKGSTVGPRAEHSKSLIRRGKPHTSSLPMSAMLNPESVTVRSSATGRDSECVTQLLADLRAGRRE